MTALLPEQAELYKRTPSFTETTVPAGLLKDHSTKEGVWGLIRIEQGQLLYEVTDPRRPRLERVFAPEDTPPVIEPTFLHRVAPLGSVRFHVEFFRVPSAS